MVHASLMRMTALQVRDFPQETGMIVRRSCSAVFSVVNAVLVRPLAYPNPERLVWVAPYDDRGQDDVVFSPSGRRVWVTAGRERPRTGGRAAPG